MGTLGHSHEATTEREGRVTRRGFPGEAGEELTPVNAETRMISYSENDAKPSVAYTDTTAISIPG